MRDPMRASSLIVAVVILGIGAVGASAQSSSDGTRGPGEFTGRIACGDQIRPEAVTSDEGIKNYRGGGWQQSIVTMSDPRFDGKIALAADHDSYADLGGLEVWISTLRIVNDEGAWQEIPSMGPTLPDGTAWGSSSTFVGEGAYEGHLAFTFMTFDDCTWDVRGVIIEGDVLEAPEPVEPL